MIILGIDPGLSGAICAYDGRSMSIFDMPTFTVPINRKMRRVVDEDKLAGILSGFTDAFAVVENVHSMPSQGVASAFTFGQGYGAIRGVLAALGIPRRYVEPSVWKRAFQLTHDKDMSRRRASELLPAFAIHWPLKKHDGRAESALLAYYGLKHYGT